MYRLRNLIIISILLLFIGTFSSNVYSQNTPIKEIGNPDELECYDIDLDGFTSSVCRGLDCNDNDLNINPNSLEICGNEIDENCDGIIEECLVDDLNLIEVTYSGELKTNSLVNFKINYESTLDDNELFVYVNNESFLVNGTEFNFIFTKIGTNTITFVLDPENRIKEIDETNNKKEIILEIEGFYICDFQNEITGCVVCSCGEGEVCTETGECKEEDVNSPIINNEIRSISFFPSDYASYIFVGGQRILEKNEYVTKYYHNDPTGTLSFTTDENGEKSNEITHMPFGEYDKDVFGKSYFDGKEQDDSGLYYYGARYYDPSIGRFTQVDPILRDDETTYYLDKANPFRYIDREGYEAEENKEEKKEEKNGIDDDKVIESIDKILEIRSVEDVKERSQKLATGKLKREGTKFVKDTFGGTAMTLGRITYTVWDMSAGEVIKFENDLATGRVVVNNLRKIGGRDYYDKFSDYTHPDSKDEMRDAAVDLKKLADFQTEFKLNAAYFMETRGFTFDQFVGILKSLPLPEDKKAVDADIKFRKVLEEQGNE